MPDQKPKRIFFSVNIPYELSASVLSFAERLRECGAHMCAASEMHATLAFFGNLDDGGYRIAVETLKRIEARPFNISLEGFGILSRRIVYARISGGATELSKITSFVTSSHE